MIHLEYIGSRAVISQHGISFKEGKKDKFIYLPYVYEILNSINSSYELNKKHSYQIKIDNLAYEKLYLYLISVNPNINTEIEDRLNNYLNHLDEEEQEVSNRVSLSDFEKNVYISNLKLMRNYKIQRAKNKIFYFYCTKAIVEIIKTNKIKKIELPFSEKFWHVLKTIQGKLALEKITSNISTQEKDDILLINLTTNIY
ncbi:hypothetical protein [Arcobacter aquimarinus]|uniref:hypothetical protein n=1 Tax=Arcobacter aquimarinus TaxID=1315211 RepID=UPI003BAF5958